MRSKAWLAAPVLLAHADVTKTLNIFQWVQNLGVRRYLAPYFTLASHCLVTLDANYTHVFLQVYAKYESVIASTGGAAVADVTDTGSSSDESSDGEEESKM
jgi:hypothetical protein